MTSRRALLVRRDPHPTLSLRGRGRHCYTPLLTSICLTVWSIGGCDLLGKNSNSNDKTSATELLSKAEGPIKLTVSSHETQFETGKTAKLTLKVEADAGTSVQIADYAKALENSENHFEYRVAQSRTKPPVKNAAGKVEWVNEYDVEFILAGDYEIPAVSLTYSTDSSAANSQPNSGATTSTPPTPAPVQAATEFKTEAIKINVREATVGGISDQDLQKIPKLSPVELPSPWRIWRWVIAGAVIAVFILGLVYYRKQQRMKAEEVIIIPAHEWARLQIAKLLVDDLLSRSLVQEFYYRVSDIVRGYIERRFAVAAPEMTTEEFLVSLSKDRRFGEKDRNELNEFMNACDIVKYARHQPTTAEANAMLDAATDYIERTRERLNQTHDGAAQGEQLQEQAA